MATNWKGYFLQAVETNKKFPLTYVAEYSSLPNAREEIKAYRDDNTRNLTRVTASGHKTSISLKTRKRLNLSEKIEIQKFFTDAESNANQRKIQLKYWNDETNEYKTAYFYRPDITFKILKATDDDIYYDSIEIGLVEY